MRVHAYGDHTTACVVCALHFKYSSLHSVLAFCFDPIHRLGFCDVLSQTIPFNWFFSCVIFTEVFILRWGFDPTHCPLIPFTFFFSILLLCINSFVLIFVVYLTFILFLDPIYALSLSRGMVFVKSRCLHFVETCILISIIVFVACVSH